LPLELVLAPQGWKGELSSVERPVDRRSGFTLVSKQRTRLD
jgi:hypothetical protein